MDKTNCKHPDGDLVNVCASCMVDRGREQATRIAALESALREREEVAQNGHPNPCTLGPLCPYCEIERQKARAESAEQALAAAREREKSAVTAAMKNESEIDRRAICVVSDLKGACARLRVLLDAEALRADGNAHAFDRIKDQLAEEREDHRICALNFANVQAQLAALRSATPAMDAGRVERVAAAIAANAQHLGATTTIDEFARNLARAVLLAADGPAAHRPDDKDGGGK